MQFVLQDSHVQTVPYNGAADFAAPQTNTKHALQMQALQLVGPLLKARRV